MSRVRILHCMETLGSGGVEQRRLLLAKYLDANHYEQHLVCSRALRGFDAKLGAAGMKVYAIGSLGKLWNLSYYMRLYRIVKKVRPHIIHGAVFEGVISAAVVGTLCRVPVIILEETSDPDNRSGRASKLLRFFSRLADFVIAISPSVAKYLKHIEIAEKKIRLINNGIDRPQVPAADEAARVREQFGIGPSDFVVGSVGRLRDFHKRFSDLIKALVIIREQAPGVKLMIVGTGEDSEALRTLATELGVSESVIFAGFQEKTSAFYAAMDLFALASHMEGFGLVLIEAMFFRLPVVATSVGGMKDIVIDGETGFLVPRHSPESLAKAILTLYGDEQLRTKLGAAGYDRAVSQYSREVYVGNVDRVYREALNERDT